MAGLDPRLSGSFSLYKDHGIDSIGSGSGDSESKHE
jgi:hypothetical protein